MSSTLRIGILAGEGSGDILGASLMAAIVKRCPNVIFEGIGGPLMSELGLVSQVPMERLSVMGFIDPLKRLPELLRIRKRLKQHFINKPPAVFIGIDSPDFNLGLEAKLKQAGIPTIHYVSPSVWAWREKRIKKIAKAVDLVLTLFPFETEIYKRNNIPVAFVGHPLADEIPLQVDLIPAKQTLGLVPDKKVLALLPGSRQGEVSRLAPIFLETATLCQREWPDMQFVLPCANQNRKAEIESMLKESDFQSKVTLMDGQSRKVMAAADCILIASGTATLEALLFKKPMLVCYRMGLIFYGIVSRLIKVPYFSLPNLLAGRKLVEELVQDEVNAESLFKKIKLLLEDQSKQQKLTQEYTTIHQSLKRDASEKACDEVLRLIQA